MPAFKTLRAIVSGTALALAAAALPAHTAPAQKDIGATGTIEPHGGVVMLSGVPGAVIKAINVRVGQSVKAGEVLMDLEDRDERLQFNAAQSALEMARRHELQQISDANEALALAQTRAQNADLDAKNYRDLGPNATSQRQIEAVDLAAKEAHTALDAERRRNAQVRKDTAAEVSNATKRYNYERAKLGLYHVTAPSAGVVLQVTQHVGEVLGGAPALSIGDISSMYVACDAFQGDLLKIQPGMKATVSSNALGHELAGRVEWVGRLITTSKQTGQFKIKLDDPGLPSRLVGMEVNVKVQLGS